jgi:hypothetical protein
MYFIFLLNLKRRIIFLFKLFKRIFSSVAIFFCFLYLSTPVSAHQAALNGTDGQPIGEVRCCNLCDPNLQLQLNGEDTLQRNTNWCFATCMNIVHRDILSKGIQLRPPIDENRRIEDFAGLGFIFFPVQNGVVLPFQLTRDEDLEAIRCIKIFTAHLNLPSDEEGFALECKAFHEHLKYLSTDKRIEMLNGSQLFTPMPQRLKELIPLDGGSASIIFNEATGNPDFCQLNPAIFDGRTNPWGQIFQDIWNHERMVILNMANVAGGGIGHSVVAYAAIQYHDGRHVILVYNPATGNPSEILTNFPPVVDIGGSMFQILSYNTFSY